MTNRTRRRASPASTLISKLTLGLVASALVMSPIAFGEEHSPVTSPEIEQTKTEINAKKEEIKQDRAELKKDRAEKRELRKKLHAERKAARKAKKELIKKDSVPAEGQPVQ